MGLKIDLPIETIEEATFLDGVLTHAADQAQAWIDAVHSTPEERAEARRKLVLAQRLRARMTGGS